MACRVGRLKAQPTLTQEKHVTSFRHPLLALLLRLEGPHQAVQTRKADSGFGSLPLLNQDDIIVSTWDRDWTRQI